MADDSVEICLLWGDWQIHQWWSCMTQSAWTSWVQAIGSISAIFISIWISRRQLNTDKKHAVLQARILAKGSVDCIQTMSYGLQAEIYGMIKTSALGLREFVTLSQATRPELLPAAAMQAFVSIRLNAVMVLEAFESYEKTPTSVNAIEFARLLEYYGGLLGPSVDILHQRHNCVRAERYSARESAEKVIKAAKALHYGIGK